MAFDSLEPIGQRRDDFNAARLIAAVFNAQGANVSAMDAMPFLDDVETEQTDADIQQEIALFDGML